MPGPEPLRPLPGAPAIASLLALLVPSRCAVCDAPRRETGGGGVCPACWAALPRLAPDAACPRCALPGDGAPCAACRRDPPPVARTAAFGLYAGGLKTLVAAFKFRGFDLLAAPLRSAPRRGGARDPARGGRRRARSRALDAPPQPRARLRPGRAPRRVGRARPRPAVPAPPRAHAGHAAPVRTPRLTPPRERRRSVRRVALRAGPRPRPRGRRRDDGRHPVFRRATRSPSRAPPKSAGSSSPARRSRSLHDRTARPPRRHDASPRPESHRPQESPRATSRATRSRPRSTRCAASPAKAPWGRWTFSARASRTRPDGRDARPVPPDDRRDRRLGPPREHLREADGRRARDRPRSRLRELHGDLRARGGARDVRAPRHGGQPVHGVDRQARPRAQGALRRRRRPAGLPQAQPRRPRPPPRDEGERADLQGHLRRAARDRLEGPPDDHPQLRGPRRQAARRAAPTPRSRRTTRPASSSRSRRSTASGSRRTGTSSRCSSGSIPCCAGASFEAGHRLRVYVPYGRDWYAYSTRRLKENPSIARHVLRSMVGLGPAGG